MGLKDFCINPPSRLGKIMIASVIGEQNANVRVNDRTNTRTRMFVHSKKMKKLKINIFLSTLASWFPFRLRKITIAPLKNKIPY